MSGNVCSKSVLFMLSSTFGCCVSYSTVAEMIFNIKLTLKDKN